MCRNCSASVTSSPPVSKGKGKGKAPQVDADEEEEDDDDDEVDDGEEEDSEEEVRQSIADAYASLTNLIYTGRDLRRD